jgi:predicted nucleotidyltransferase
MINMNNLPGILRKDGIKERLIKICQENDVTFLAIFGSFIRGEEKERSDIDILIKFKEGSKMTLLDVVRLEREFRKLFKKKVDLVTDGALNKYIKDEILNSMRVVYEKG